MIYGRCTVTDEELVALVARNESWALAELYDRYARLVFSLALQILNDRSAGEEIVQEVFAKLWRGAHEYTPERGKFSSWLIGITRYHCIDELRRRRARPAVDSIDREPRFELVSDDDPAEAAAHSLERQTVQTALAQLPPEQRRVIEMAFFRGLTHQEIAARCREPPGTVKTRIRLGMQKLRELLKDESD